MLISDASILTGVGTIALVQGLSQASRANLLKGTYRLAKREEAVETPLRSWLHPCEIHADPKRSVDAGCVEVRRQRRPGLPLPAL
jgi:hypothetical protein